MNETIQEGKEMNHMMKKMIALVTVLVLVFALTACQQADPAPKADPAEVVANIWKEFTEANVDQLPAFMELDAEMLKDMYGVDPEWLTAYTCQIPMMNVHATEIFVAHVKDGHMEDVKKALEERQKSLEMTWEMYLPAQYELVKNSQTLTSGNYILYAVTEKGDSIKGIFEKAAK